MWISVNTVSENTEKEHLINLDFVYDMFPVLEGNRDKGETKVVFQNESFLIVKENVTQIRNLMNQVLAGYGKVPFMQ